jgi:hypothetical protein
MQFLAAVEFHGSLNIYHTLPGRIGTGILYFSVKIPNLSSVTGVLRGA